jgi:hypothetical protein
VSDREPGPPRERTPRLAELRDAIAARARVEREQAQGDTLRDLLSTALQCVAWVALGLFLIAWAFHTTSETWGRIAFLSGIAIGNGGWIFTMLAAYRRGEKRGDW